MSCVCLSLGAFKDTFFFLPECMNSYMCFTRVCASVSVGTDVAAMSVRAAQLATEHLRLMCIRIEVRAMRTYLESKFWLIGFASYTRFSSETAN